MSIPWTAARWYLNPETPGAPEAATALGKTLTDKLAAAQAAIARGADVKDTARRLRDEMYLVMNRYKALGAREAKPEMILVRCIEDALGLRLSR